MVGIFHQRRGLLEFSLRLFLEFPTQICLHLAACLGKHQVHLAKEAWHLAACLDKRHLGMVGLYQRVTQADQDSLACQGNQGNLACR